MSQQLLALITSMSRAIEALAERVTQLEQRPTPLPLSDIELSDLIAPGGSVMVKRGPGRPRKAADDGPQ